MRWTAAQVANLQTLLLHEEKDNILLGLCILSENEDLLPQGIIAALNLLVQLSQHQEIKTLAESILGKQINFSTPKRPLDIATLSLELAIFPLAYYTPKRTWKRALLRYEKYASVYEPLFLKYPHWQKWYRALVQLFALHGEAEKLLHYCDKLLQVQPEDFLLNQHRFNAINILLEQGKAYEHLQAQESWLFTWQRFYPKTDCMIYTLLGRLHMQYYQNIAQAEAYFLKALNHESKPQWYAYAAMSAHHLSEIYIKSQQLEKALQYAQMAIQWQSNHSDYYTTLAYLEWQHLKVSQQALFSLEKALQLEPTNAQALSYILSIHIANKDKNAAIKILENILTLRHIALKYRHILFHALHTYIDNMQPSLHQKESIQLYIKNQERLPA